MSNCHGKTVEFDGKKYRLTLVGPCLSLKSKQERTVFPATKKKNLLDIALNVFRFLSWSREIVSLISKRALPPTLHKGVKMASAKLRGIVTLNLNSSGVGKNLVGRPKAEIDEALARELYVNQALPLAAVAAELGISVLTLRARLEEFGIEARLRGRPVGRRVLQQREGVITLNREYTERPEAVEALVTLLAAEAGATEPAASEVAAV